MRPTKARSIEQLPECRLFRPVYEEGKGEEGQPVSIGLDMLEAMRLVDLEGLPQDEAARRMEISTPTLCRILCRGRSRAALALSQGKTINLEGGNIMMYNENKRHGFCHGRMNGPCSPESEQPREGRGKALGMCRGRGSGECARDPQAADTVRPREGKGKALGMCRGRSGQGSAQGSDAGAGAPRNGEGRGMGRGAGRGAGMGRGAGQGFGPRDNGGSSETE